ncbi:ABC transporter ATP-binding protein [Roseibium sp.]
MITFSAADLSVALRTGTVLDDVSFKAKAGELVGIIGPNGAGKSTLLRAMAGLQSHLGKADWNDHPVNKTAAAARARLIAYMPQEPTLHWAIPCREVVLLGRLPHHGQFAGPSRADRDAAEDAMSQMDVLDFADRPFDTLSGGEQARVLVARMLAQGAPAILADEPINGLDPAHQIGLMETFQSIARTGRLVCVSLHDLTLAGRWCDRLLLLEGGRLVCDSTPGQAFNSGVIEKVYGIDTRVIHLAERPTIVPCSVKQRPEPNTIRPDNK